MKIKLFYSYCHADQRYREEIAKSLSLLKKEQLLHEWHDRSIIPGTSISKVIEKNLDSSHIYLFLFSQSFIASEPCNDEWEYVKKIVNNRSIYRVPIILEECSWQDFLGQDDVKALPNNGKPIKSYDNTDEAYQQIYKGIKEIIEDYKKCFEPKQEFLQEIKKLEFISQEEISIEDIFVFPRLESSMDASRLYLEIKNEEDILGKKYALIHGEEVSGKTALCKHLFLCKVKEDSPVLFIDLEEIQKKSPNEKIFRKKYEEQFNGDYDIWKKQDKEITIIFDNLSSSKNSIGHIERAKEIFNCIIIVAVTSDDFQAYFRNERCLSEFAVIEIKELSHVSLENLIRKRLLLADSTINHELIDRHEDKVLQILNNGIVPRYPFVVLSILQTFEAYMPSDLEVSSYGHCYKALIVACLIKSGIDRRDSELSGCFQLLENYAFHVFIKMDTNSFDQFKEQYNKSHITKESNIKRLTKEHSIIAQGKFRGKYEYYYFGNYIQ